jgi:hypothetical protein
MESARATPAKTAGSGALLLLRFTVSPVIQPGTQGRCAARAEPARLGGAAAREMDGGPQNRLDSR